MKAKDKWWWLGVMVGVFLMFGVKGNYKMGVWLRSKVIYPAIWLVEMLEKGRLYFKKQRSLILENERWRERYAKVVSSCGVITNESVKEGININKDVYGWVEGRIVLIKGPSLEIETNQYLKAKEGVVVLDGWLVGRWVRLDDYKAEVLSWLWGGTWEQIEVVDNKGNLIGNGVLRVKEGKVVVSRILRGLKLGGGERVRLLSGRYVDMPIIGLLKKKRQEDSVYQEWQLDAVWKHSMRLGKKVYLIFNLR